MYDMRFVERSQINLYDLRKGIEQGLGDVIIHPFDEIDLFLPCEVKGEKGTVWVESGLKMTFVCAYSAPKRVVMVAKNLYEVRRMTLKYAPTCYFASEVRKHLNDSNFLNNCSKDLIDVITPRKFTEYLENGEVANYADKFWIPSATEVFGEDNFWDKESDTIWRIFEEMRDRYRCLKKKVISTPEFWWTRTLCNGGETFVAVSAEGTSHAVGARAQLGVVPCFEINFEDK